MSMTDADLAAHLAEVAGRLLLEVRGEFGVCHHFSGMIWRTMNSAAC